MAEEPGSLDHQIEMFDEALKIGGRAFGVARTMLKEETGRDAGAQQAAQAALQAYSDAIQIFAVISGDADYMAKKGKEAPALAKAIASDLGRLTFELNAFVAAAERSERVDLATVISKYIGETEKNWGALKAL